MTSIQHLLQSIEVCLLVPCVRFVMCLPDCPCSLPFITIMSTFEPRFCTLQVSLAYTNILALYPTPFTCFNASEYTLWSSDPVLIPTDSAGSLTTARLRTGVIALQRRRCRVMPVSSLVEVRPRLSDTRLLELDPAAPVTLQVESAPNSFKESALSSIFNIST
jgi:hypothetical protein